MATSVKLPTGDVPSRSRQTRQLSPEQGSNDGPATAGKTIKRRRSVPFPAVEDASDDPLVWTLDTWMKNELISPDKVIAAAMKFQLDCSNEATTVFGETSSGTATVSEPSGLIDVRSKDDVQDVISTTPGRSAMNTLGVQRPGVDDVHTADDMQDVVSTAPGSSERSDETTTGVHRPGVDDGHIADEMQDVVGTAPASSERSDESTTGVQHLGVDDVHSADGMQGVMDMQIEQRTMIKGVRFGEHKRSQSSTLERPRTTQRLSSSSNVTRLAAIAVSAIHPPSSVQVKQEPPDDNYSVPDPPRLGDRLDEFVVVQDGDRLVISLDDGETFASGDESDDLAEIPRFEKKLKKSRSNWGHGLNETDLSLEKTLFGKREAKTCKEVQEDEDGDEDEDVFLKDDAYGIGATDDSAMSTPELLRKKL